MDSTPKRKPGRPSNPNAKPKKDKKFSRQKSLAETADELVRTELTIHRYIHDEIVIAAKEDFVSRQEVQRRLLAKWANWRIAKRNKNTSAVCPEWLAADD